MNDQVKKQAEEFTAGIIKRSRDLTEEFVASLDNGNLKQQVTDKIANMSEEDLKKYAEDIAYAKGIAYGEAMTKEAALDEAINVVYTIVMEKIAEVLGEEKAKEIDTKLRDGEPPLAEIAEVATEAAAKKLVEQAGGDKVVKENPEVSQEIAQTAATIGNQVASEIAKESEPKESVPAE